MAGLETAASEFSNEFQRADTAPLATKGNGVLNSGDVTQARRYAAAIDPATPAGGSFQPVVVIANPLESGRVFESLLGLRSIDAVSTEATAGSTATVSVSLNPEGGETAANFTLSYDPMKLGNPRVALAEGMPADTVLTVNTNVAGEVTVLVDSSQSFAQARRRQRWSASHSMLHQMLLRVRRH